MARLGGLRLDAVARSLHPSGQAQPQAVSEPPESYRSGNSPIRRDALAPVAVHQNHARKVPCKRQPADDPVEGDVVGKVHRQHGRDPLGVAEGRARSAASGGDRESCRQRTTPQRRLAGDA
jgi:hypothetical protein